MPCASGDTSHPLQRRVGAINDADRDQPPGELLTTPNRTENIVTIAGGAVFGAVGLILAAPFTSAAVRISGDLAKAKAEIKSSPGAAGPEPAATQT